MIKKGLWLRLGVIWVGALVLNSSSNLVLYDQNLALIMAFAGFTIMGFGLISSFFWMLDHDGEDLPKR